VTSAGTAPLRPPREGPPREGSSAIDFDVHGLVGIRLIDPSPRDVRAVSAQIGPLRGRLEREPEITIRFVADVPSRGVLRYVEPERVGFTDEAFVVLSRRSGGKPEAQVPLDAVGQSFEILCRSGVGPVPLLRPILDLTMLARGVAAVHASAFTFNGKGTMIAGWARGAKTTSLLAFMSNGAELIADDCVYVDPDGNRLYGLPEPISLRARHLEEFPVFRDRVGWRDRSRLRAVSLIGDVAAAFAGEGELQGARKFADRIAGIADDASVAVSPDRLSRRCAFSGRLETAFLSIPHERDEVSCLRVDPEWLADRLVFSLRAQRLHLLSGYLAFRFAFPDRRSLLLEQASNTEKDVLMRALSGANTYVLHHPFPVSAQALFESVAALLG
jgi:hypothetical protein